ncbi:MAG: hypothetical protein WBJ75_09710 [Pseudohongiellaceae bacterium]
MTMELSTARTSSLICALDLMEKVIENNVMQVEIKATKDVLRVAATAGWANVMGCPSVLFLSFDICLGISV